MPNKMYKRPELERQQEIRGYVDFLESQTITHVARLLMGDHASEEAVRRMILTLDKRFLIKEEPKRFRLFWVAQGSQSETMITCFFSNATEIQVLAICRWFDSRYGWSKIHRKVGPMAGYPILRNLFSTHVFYGLL